MKKVIKYLIIVVICMPIFINAKQYKYNDALNKANQYITNFNGYHDYIVTKNMPYDFENGKAIPSSKFTKGGFISREEYKITNYRSNSYLATGLEYWTLTQYDVNKNVVISHTISEKNIEETSNARITQYVKNEAKVSGSGTKNNPWYFLDVLSVNLVSSNPNRGTLSTKPCENNTQGMTSIVLNQYGNTNAIFYACEHPDYRYYKSSCESYILKDNGNYYIKYGIPDNTICRMDFGYRTYKLTLEQCENCTIQQTSPTTIYKAHNLKLYFEDQYGEKTIDGIQIPKKTGYTFEGYYKEQDFKTASIIKEDGKFNNDNITGDTTLYVKMRPHNYTIKYDCNGGTGTTSQTNHIYDKEEKLKNVSCYKDGYIFKGWSETPTGTAKYSNEQSISNLTSIDGGEVILFAVWEKCQAGYYSEGVSLACSKCAAGTYSSAGSTKCSTCPVGTYSSAGSSSCTKCAAGKYNPNTGSTSSSACQTCPAGTYSSAGASSCTKCAAGTYNSNTGSTSSTACIKCPVGTYSATQGSSTCTNCPSGYTSAQGANAINKCYITVQDGKYIATANTATQTNCAAGTYKTSHTVYYGNTSSCSACQTCYTNTAGSKTCPTQITYTVSYNMNGGSGGPSSQTKYCGTNLTLSSSKPTKSGYTFNGWKASNGTTYSAGGSYTANSSTTMTAQWKTSRVYLVKDGQDQTSLTGGWKGYSHYLAGNHGEAPDIDYGSNRIKLTNDNWINCSGTVYTKNKISFSGFTKLVFDGEVYEGTMNMGGSFKVKTSAGGSWDENLVKNHEFTEYEDGNISQDYTMNISSLNGSYVVGFGLFGNNAASQNYIRIFNLYLE